MNNAINGVIKLAFLTLWISVGFNSNAQVFEWAKSMGAEGNEGGHSIAVDAFENVYTLGGFEGTVDFNPGASIYNLTSAGSYDMFISKIDASGNFVWPQV